jgi:hypothetical protein
MSSEGNAKVATIMRMALFALVLTIQIISVAPALAASSPADCYQGEDLDRLIGSGVALPCCF